MDVAHGNDPARPIGFDGHPALGGRDRALGPFEHLLGALGACCQITADIVARSRRVELGEMRTRIETSFDDYLLVFGEDDASKFDTLDIDIAVDTSMSSAELADMGEGRGTPLPPRPTHRRYWCPSTQFGGLLDSWCPSGSRTVRPAVRRPVSRCARPLPVPAPDARDRVGSTSNSCSRFSR